MYPFKSVDMHNIYSDLMKVFISHGHCPYIVTPREKQTGEKTELIDYGNYAILKVCIGNTSNVSFVEKGVSTVLLEIQFKRAIRKYLADVKFDLILYSTPPITLGGVIKSLKKQHQAKTYLMLKDIFPQNAIDIGLFSSKSLIAKYFRARESQFYSVSDRIGCMSQANVDFLLKNNPTVSPDKVEILPNAILLNKENDRSIAKHKVRQIYGIPDDAITLLFGGNMGKPQGIPFLVDCLRALKNSNEYHFIVCGSGSEYHILKDYKNFEQPTNLTLINYLPKDEYDQLACGCDVGLIFLDHRFTIPNYPSRILSYMENCTPVICATDPNTDIGVMVEINNCGFACESNSVPAFIDCLKKLKESDMNAMGKSARKTCEDLFSVEECYKKILYSCEQEYNIH